jgi:16S rRNA G966 N2-methylase RsmD
MNLETKIGSEHVGVNDRSVGRLQRALRIVREVGLSGILQLMREHGLRQSAHFVIRNIRFMIAVQADRRFDRVHGVDTSGSIQLDSLNICGPNRSFGNEYVSTSAKSFAWMMKALPIDIAGYTFIDIGAGKGRTLLLASKYPFSRIMGVEFAHELVAVAQKNIERFSIASEGRTIEIVETDAAQFEFPQNPLVVYLYNPFSATLFAKVLNALVVSLRLNPRDCFLIFATTMDGTMDGVRAIIAETDAFQEVNTNPMPLFWDSVRSIHYVVFHAQKLDMKNKLKRPDRENSAHYNQAEVPAADFERLVC